MRSRGLFYAIDFKTPTASVYIVKRGQIHKLMLPAPFLFVYLLRRDERKTSQPKA